MTRTALGLGLVLLLAACGGQETPGASADASLASSATPVASALADGQDLPTVLVYKTASCGCCLGWVKHLEAAGFKVDARNVGDLMSVKQDAGVPGNLSSCHTAIVDGYVVEGHVPADVMKKMLAERPEAAGIATPGMPIGSPGMEGPNAKPYEVFTFDREGGVAQYVTVDPR